MKAFSRHIVDRTLTPYFDAQNREIDRIVAAHAGGLGRSEPDDPPDPVLRDFNHMLHELRTIELRHLPVDGGVLLSAGCAGLWYFEWLEDCAGPFERHIGVELYSPEPEGLPANVTWIRESASRMSSVADGSVDVVFSGQNIEHLWIDDLAGFLSEAHRVLRPGGRLVVDSPNRLAVEALNWVQPEHTIEMSATEAESLLHLAGFDVVVTRGLWNCRDHRTGMWLPLHAPPGDVRSLLDRATTRGDIDDDFVWWIEARRADRPVDADAVRANVESLFAQHWSNRVNRGAARAFDSNGLVYRSQGFPIFAGSYRVTSSASPLSLRVLADDGRLLASGTGHVEGTLASTEFGVIVELATDGPTDEVFDDVQIRVDMFC